MTLAKLIELIHPPQECTRAPLSNTAVLPEQGMDVAGKTEMKKYIFWCILSCSVQWCNGIPTIAYIPRNADQQSFGLLLLPSLQVFGLETLADRPAGQGQHPAPQVDASLGLSVGQRVA